MFDYVWPMMLLVISNTVYQICSKSVPKEMDPFASLTVTYLIAAVACGILYFFFNRGGNLLREYSKLNWAPIVLGVVIIGLEVGWIYAYKAGWPVSTAFVVQSAFLAFTLLLVGWLLFKEQISWSKAVGVLICMAGLYFLNK